jgi:hypothetical protein
MSEQKLQRLLDRMALDSQKAHDLAHELYGPDAQLFAESEGLYAMDGDEDAGGSKRQEHIRLAARHQWRCGGGAW